LVINLSMFKIQLENGEFYKSKGGRVQHYGTIEKADAKIQRLGEIASGAKAVKCEGKKAKAVVKASKGKKAKKSKKTASHDKSEIA
jgi:hypothetical protein